MKKVAIIPLRKGSKSIKGKNKKKLLGRPLFSWVLEEAIFSNLDEIYIFTDDEDIIDFVNKHYQWSTKVKTLKRSDENANDVASTESALLEFSNLINHNFDILCLLQATSPLTISKDINACLNKVIVDGYSSSLSVVRTHRFVWSEDGNPMNYDVFNRPRRQDFNGLLIENGAVYAIKKESFLNSKNRLSPNIGLVEMSEDTLTEIDTENDWIVVEQLIKNRLQHQRTAKQIKYLVLDVDGVFTNGRVTFSKDVELSKEFDMRDGMGLEILREHGVQLLVMTSEDSELVKQRMKKLKIAAGYYGIKDKYALLKSIALNKSIDFNHIAYIGDDINDMAPMCAVGWSFTPNNAMTKIKAIADITLNKESGNGAIREASEFIINYNKRYEC
ncbi:acylneuraminate cytidylyltransferase [Polaribacter sargassicola]|uniref:acylneuraminate cytidylyltransferase n=1 Tax=Polaribacter sargassicola TaxID=2836891 RepID=UPI001F36AE59|nr:acylneuraminate cytidylyltransferase [Polaribacter sp. DS7-9]MCG1036604.1 acylneuraminate cytidylyltransferase [Polaribacter sp. DS7-9]